MKILFCSLSDRPHRSQAVLDHNIKYYTKHGYRYIHETNSLDDSRHPAWSKILLLERELINNPTIDYAVWVDDDIMILDHSKKIEDFINQNSFRNILICEGISDSWLMNSGFMICRNTIETIKFLRHIYDKANPECHRKGVWEQQALHDYHLVDSTRITIIPHRTMQSAWRFYQNGDFAIHFLRAFGYTGPASAWRRLPKSFRRDYYKNPKATITKNIIDQFIELVAEINARQNQKKTEK